MILILKLNYGTDETSNDQHDIEYEVYELCDDMEKINNLIEVYKNDPWYETHYLRKEGDFDALDAMSTEEMENYLNEH